VIESEPSQIFSSLCNEFGFELKNPPPNPDRLGQVEFGRWMELTNVVERLSGEVFLH
jgi:hypothetical protein